jgi:hypothetical protein
MARRAVLARNPEGAEGRSISEAPYPRSNVDHQTLARLPVLIADGAAVVSRFPTAELRSGV